jgi:hypothetical protein
METLADLKKKGIAPDPVWAAKHVRQTQPVRDAPRRGGYDSTGIYRPPENAPLGLNLTHKIE